MGVSQSFASVRHASGPAHKEKDAMGSLGVHSAAQLALEMRAAHPHVGQRCC